MCTDADPAGHERWIVLDVETTGLDARRDALLAVSAVALLRCGERLLLLPGDSFDARLAQPAGAEPALVLRAFDEWAGASPRLGYQAAFDRQVLERAARDVLARKPPRRAWIDIAALACAARPREPRRTLDDWFAHFGIECLQRHDAAADALATAELMLRLWPLLRQAGARTAADLARLERDGAWLGAR